MIHPFAQAYFDEHIHGTYVHCCMFIYTHESLYYLIVLSKIQVYKNSFNNTYIIIKYVSFVKHFMETNKFTPILVHNYLEK